MITMNDLKEERGQILSTITIPKIEQIKYTYETMQKFKNIRTN